MAWRVTDFYDPCPSAHTLYNYEKLLKRIHCATFPGNEDANRNVWSEYLPYCTVIDNDLDSCSVFSLCMWLHHSYTVIGNDLDSCSVFSLCMWLPHSSLRRHIKCVGTGALYFSYQFRHKSKCSCLPINKYLAING